MYFFIFDQSFRQTKVERAIDVMYILEQEPEVGYLKSDVSR